MGSRPVLGGIHHITAIAGAPANNLAFYVRTLGLRLVKKTVNFDDPGTYHLYYGDHEGRPGSILTFFPWSYAAKGRAGAGMVAATAFEVTPGSLGTWIEYLGAAGVAARHQDTRFDEEVVSFSDDDGLRLELIDAGSEDRSDVPDLDDDALVAIRGFRAVTLDVGPTDATAAFLEGVLGFQASGESASRIRFTTGGSRRCAVVDVLKTDGEPAGRSGAGTVHHVAFRVSSDDEQLFWRKRIEEAGYRVTPVKDRQYFKSIYFREPGGVLFEIATDPPGFTLDESVEDLGSSLKLPPWLEPRRQQIEQHLQDLPTPVS